MVSQQLEYHFLYASTLFASRHPTEVQTVLGSCVSVCLFDTIAGVGGINHFMLPFWSGEGLATAKYGNIAIELLVEKLVGLGCTKKSLVAKVFGGANQFADHEMYSIGKRNILIANDTLASLRIPVVASSVGGDVGRKIRFSSGTGQVLMKFVNQ